MTITVLQMPHSAGHDEQTGVLSVPLESRFSLAFLHAAFSHETEVGRYLDTIEEVLTPLPEGRTRLQEGAYPHQAKIYMSNQCSISRGELIQPLAGQRSGISNGSMYPKSATSTGIPAATADSTSRSASPA